MESEVLSQLQKNIKALDSKACGLDEFAPPREEIFTLRLEGFFAAATSATVSALPALASEANFTLSKV